MAVGDPLTPTPVTSNPSPIPNVTGPRLLFAVDTLRAAGAPITPNNVLFMLAWFQGERTVDANDPWGYNPANISHTVPGHPASRGTIPSSNGPPVQNYGSWSEGTAALAASLHEPFARPILDALMANSDPHTTAAAAQRSGWAAGGYGGGLPGIVSAVMANPQRYAAGPISGGGRTAAAVPAGAGILPAGFSIPGLGAGGIVGGLSGIDPTAVFQAFAKAFAFFSNPHNWSRILIGGMGLGAIVFGLVLVMRDIGPPAVQNATGFVGKLGKDLAIGAVA